MNIITAADFEKRVKDLKKQYIGVTTNNSPVVKSEMLKNQYLSIVGEVLKSMGYEAGINAYESIKKEILNDK